MTIEIENINDKIEEMRHYILNLYNENNNLFDINDIKRIQYDNRLIEREILSRKTFQESKESFVNALKFRKENKLCNMKEEDFPIELYKLSVIFPFGQDKFGNGLIYVRYRLYKPIKQLESLTKRYLVYLIEKYDLETNQKGISVLIDTRQIGFMNIDMELMFFLLKLMLQHFPYIICNVYVYEFPLIFRSFWLTIKHLIPIDKLQCIKFITKNNINEFIDQNQLPLFMGGNCRKSIYHIPENCSTPNQFGFTDKEFKQLINKQYKQALKECEKERKIYLNNEF